MEERPRLDEELLVSDGEGLPSLAIVAGEGAASEANGPREGVGEAVD